MSPFIRAGLTGGCSFLAGIYLIDSAGEPRRIGMAAGNEFSDHKFEKRNYLNLAGSKLRTSSLGPEVVLNVMTIAFDGYGRALRNPLAVAGRMTTPITVRPLA
jgi:hypothetical protein